MQYAIYWVFAGVLVVALIAAIVVLAVVLFVVFGR